MDEKQLFKEFKEAFEKNQPDFLLYEISNANENAHSNFLERILNYNNHQFLKSFLIEVLGFSGDNEITDKPIVTTQKKAIGLKKHGFIDVYIENGEQKIIIENKIKGAGDTPKQLARYVATAYGVKGNADFDNWYKKYEPNSTQSTNEDYSNIFLYYLSRLGDKEPSSDSLPDNLKQALGDNYTRLSYKDHILSWLKDTVMPKIPYQDNGLMICALLQYIAYLEYYTTTQDWQTKWVREYDVLQKLSGDDFDKYNKLSKYVNDRTLEKKDAGGVDECTAAYISTLEFLKEEIFAHDLDGYEEWRIHYTPAFIILYKQSWTELEERKYSCPTIEIVVQPPFHLISKSPEVGIAFCITHVSELCVSTNWEQRNNKKFSDRLVGLLKKNLPNKYKDEHNRHYGINRDIKINLTNYNLSNKEDRVKFYLEVIRKLEKEINLVDNVLAQMKVEKNNMSN